MGEQRLSDDAIAEVAREIRSSRIRAKYLSQVCADADRRTRLEERIGKQGRWQFGLRTLLILMTFAAVISAGLALSIQMSLRAQLLAERERLRAVQAAELARAALMEAERQRAEATRLREQQASVGQVQPDTD